MSDKTTEENNEYISACQKHEEKAQEQITKTLNLVKVLVDRREELKNSYRNQFNEFHQTIIFNELFNSDLDLTKQPEPLCNCHNEVIKSHKEVFTKRLESLKIQIKRARTLHRKAEIELYNATWKKKALLKRISEVQIAQEEAEQIRIQMNRTRIQIHNMILRINATERLDLRQVFKNDLTLLKKDLESSINIEDEGRTNMFAVKKKLSSYKRFLKNSFLDKNILLHLTF